MLEVRGVNKTYGSGKNAFKALTDVNINFGSKGLVIILGKSGCGKSTLLNIIGGLDAPTSGEVIINGRSTSSFKRADFDAYRNTFVGIVFQEFNLIDDISVFDNINMTMKLQESNSDVNTVDEALAMVGLQNLGYRKPSELSGGQRQRVSLARALLKKPEIVLADEPTGALDSATGEEVFETLKKIALDKLVIVVTHNRDLAQTYGDRIIEISDGQVISDKTRQDVEGSDVKELPDGVIEVASTGALTADAINKKLVKGKTNYVGLSHDKDRIALAYPGTVDSFYAPTDTSVFDETTPESISTDEKEFKLSKGGLTLKESIKLARGNIKRHKKRFRFINVISTLCFLFVALGLMVGMTNVNNIISDTAFDTAATYIQVAYFADTSNSYNLKPAKLSADECDKIKTTAGGKVGYGMNLFATPELSITEQNVPYDSTYDQYMYGEREASYNFTYFNGVIEVDDISTIGLKSVAGATSCKSTSEIIVSDFVAYMLGKKGFIGTDPDGRMDVQYLADIESIVGYSINIKQTKKMYKVVGVYETDYNKYAAVATGKAKQKDADNFGSLYRYEYRKLIGCSGLASALSSSTTQYSLSVDIADGGSTNSSISGDYLIYDKSAFDYDEKDPWNRVRLSWSASKDANGEYIPPEELADDEIIIPEIFVRQIANEPNWETPIESVLASSKWSAAVNSTHTFKLSAGRDSWSGTELAKFQNMKIVGVVTGGNGTMAMLSKANAEKAISAAGGYDYVYFDRGSGALSLEGTVKELKNQGFAVGSALASADVTFGLESTLSTLSKVFLFIALGMFAFAFLIIFNYISTSVKFRIKEIAVYRVIGAKSSDISKMFLAEGAGIVIRTTIAAVILGFLVSLLLDWILGMSMSMFGITFTLIRFNWFIEPLAILVGSAITVLLSSLLPVLRVTSKRPVEAVKMI